MKSVICVFIYLVIIELQYLSESLTNANGETRMLRDLKLDEYFFDDIRCFCNLPKCIASGYMCRTKKSPNGYGCFSELKDPADTTTTRHGCVDFLKNLNTKLHCYDFGRKHNSSANDHDVKMKDTALLCCHEDMCNHVGSPDNMDIKAKKLDVDENPFANVHNTKNLITSSTHTSPAVTNSYIIIGVPLCGAFILFTLIAIAIKILRTEINSSTSLKLENGNHFNKRPNTVDQSHSMCQTRRYSDCYSPDYLSEKNKDTRAKLNHLINQEYSLVPQNSYYLYVKDNNVLNQNINQSLACPHLVRNQENKLYNKELIIPLKSEWEDSNCKNHNMNLNS